MSHISFSECFENGSCRFKAHNHLLNFYHLHSDWNGSLVFVTLKHPSFHRSYIYLHQKILLKPQNTQVIMRICCATQVPIKSQVHYRIHEDITAEYANIYFTGRHRHKLGDPPTVDALASLLGFPDWNLSFITTYTHCWNIVDAKHKGFVSLHDCMSVPIMPGQFLQPWHVA